MPETCALVDILTKIVLVGLRGTCCINGRHIGSLSQGTYKNIVDYNYYSCREFSRYQRYARNESKLSLTRAATFDWKKANALICGSVIVPSWSALVFQQRYFIFRISKPWLHNNPPQDYWNTGINGIRVGTMDSGQSLIMHCQVNRVIRVHNRHLRSRFENTIYKFNAAKPDVEEVLDVSKRMYEYLFYGETPLLCKKTKKGNELLRIAEVHFICFIENNWMLIDSSRRGSVALNHTWPLATTVL